MLIGAPCAWASPVVITGAARHTRNATRAPIDRVLRTLLPGMVARFDMLPPVQTWNMSTCAHRRWSRNGAYDRRFRYSHALTECTTSRSATGVTGFAGVPDAMSKITRSDQGRCMSSGPGWHRARKYEPTAAGSRGSALTCAITFDEPAARLLRTA